MPRHSRVLSLALQLKQYMMDHPDPLTVKETEKILDLSESGAYTILTYMLAVEMVDRVKSFSRGRTYIYFLKGSYTHPIIPAKPPLVRKRSRPKLKRSSATDSKKLHARVIREDLFSEDRARIAQAPEGVPSALAILGLYEFKLQKPVEARKPEPEAIRREGPFIVLEKHGRLKHRPEGMLLLSRVHTIDLKQRHLSKLEGFESIKAFNVFFAERSAIEQGVYGLTFYVASGTNPWVKLYKVMVKTE